jgi:hypothetical protein
MTRGHDEFALDGMISRDSVATRACCVNDTDDGMSGAARMQVSGTAPRTLTGAKLSGNDAARKGLATANPNREKLL